MTETSSAHMKHLHLIALSVISTLGTHFCSQAQFFSAAMLRFALLAAVLRMFAIYPGSSLVAELSTGSVARAGQYCLS